MYNYIGIIVEWYQWIKSAYYDSSNIHILTRCEFPFVTKDGSSCLKLESQSREDYVGGLNVELYSE
jgi:hypothetical protein